MSITEKSYFKKKLRLTSQDVPFKVATYVCTLQIKSLRGHRIKFLRSEYLSSILVMYVCTLQKDKVQ